MDNDNVMAIVAAGSAVRPAVGSVDLDLVLPKVSTIHHFQDLSNHLETQYFFFVHVHFYYYYYYSCYCYCYYHFVVDLLLLLL